MQTARSLGVRPSVFLGYNDEDGTGWSDRDREMAKALRLYELAQCPGCGFPKSQVWLDSVDDAEWEFIAEEIQCITCMRLEAARSGTKSQKGLHYYIERHPKGTPHPEPVERDVAEN